MHSNTRSTAQKGQHRPQPGGRLGGMIERPTGRRPICRSQIPVRTPTPSASYRPRTVEEYMNNPRPLPRADFPVHVHRDIPVSMANNHHHQGLVQSIEKAFNVYGERIRADLRDFRGICTSLVVQEQQEADKWHSLCMKIMKERDYARQRLHILSQGRDSPPVSPTEAGMKRGREDGTAAADDRDDSSSSSSRESSADARPVRPLRQSPVHSPSRSPAQSPTFGVFTLPPLSSLTATSPTSQAGASLELRPIKKRKSSCGSSSSETTLVGKPLPADARRTLQDSNGARVKQEVRTPSPLPDAPIIPASARTLARPVGTVALPGEFTHVDLMYVPAKGTLTCRACLLEKSKTAAPAFEPKAFPTTASWDDLRDHCVIAHPDACADVARLHPAEIFELRRRLSL